MYSLPSTSHTWLPRPRWRKIGATPCTNCVGPLLKVCVHDGMTLRALAKYSRDFASERSGVDSMLLSPPLGRRAVRAHRVGVALVTRRPLVDRLELGLAPHEREDVIHAERLAETIVDRAYELEVRQLVDRPATVGEARLVPSPFECGEREHFGIQTVGERRRLRVADVVEHAAGLEELREDPARDRGVEQRTVGSDPHDNGNAEPARRPVKAVQDVLLVTRIGRQIVIGGESKDRFVRRLLGRRDDDSLDPGDPPRALHEPREHGLPGDVGEGLAGQSRRAHPRLHDGSDHRPTGTGRPCAAAAFAASATSRIARPPAASSIGESPVSTHRPKWRISSTNIWLRSVLIDSWKTSMRRSSLPYTVTDWLM